MFLTFIMVVGPQSLVPALEPLRLALVSMLVAAGAHVADRMGRGRPLTVVEPETRLALTLLVLAVLSVPTSYWTAGSLETLLSLFARSMIVFFLLANVLVTPARLRAMFWLLTLCVPVPAAVVLRDFVDGDLVRDRVQGYVSALTSNPNDVALTLNIVIPLAVALALSAKSLRPRLVVGVVVALAVGGVVATFSRAGVLYLSTTALLYLTRLRRGRLPALLLLALFAILALNVDGFVTRLGTVTDIQHEGSARERWETLWHALDLMRQHPLLGVGIGQSIIALNDTGGVLWRHIHNVYLEIGVDLGIPALVVYVLLLVRAIRSVAEVRRQWRDRDATLHHLAQGLEISLIGFAVAAMFYPISYHLFFYYLLGLAVATKVAARHAQPGTVTS